MPTLHTLTLFAAAAVVFALIPGPAVLYVVARSVGQGRAAGVASALGIETGNLVHVAAAALGLSALLASSATAFTVVKYLGAAYLIYLGVRRLLDRDDDHAPVRPPRQALPRLYSHGVAVAVFNPKTALFFLAFLPQFVDPARGSATAQIVVLGCLLVAVTAVSDCCVALLAGTAGGWLRGRVRLARGQRLASGTAYIALGVFAALTRAEPATR